MISAFFFLLGVACGYVLRKFTRKWMDKIQSKLGDKNDGS